jgi:ribosomal protein L22
MRSLVTSPQIKAKAVEVLRPLAGMSYADALYVLEIAQRTMTEAVGRLHEEQVFSPPIFQGCSPKDSGDRP